VVIYPVGRFFFEFLRLDASSIGGLNANQAFMGILAIASVAYLIIRHKIGTPKQEEPTDAGEIIQE
jgi:prolipoprotein diacylglyceryltransferase